MIPRSWETGFSDTGRFLTRVDSLRASSSHKILSLRIAGRRLAGRRVPFTFVALAGPVRLLMARTPMVRLCANADDSRLAAGFRAFAAIAEKQVRAARRADRAGGDVARGHTRIEKLPAVGG
jgi:hypothetical protein